MVSSIMHHVPQLVNGSCITCLAQLPSSIRVLIGYLYLSHLNCSVHGTGQNNANVKGSGNRYTLFTVSCIMRDNLLLVVCTTHFPDMNSASWEICLFCNECLHVSDVYGKPSGVVLIDQGEHPQ